MDINIKDKFSFNKKVYKVRRWKNINPHTQYINLCINNKSKFKIGPYKIKVFSIERDPTYYLKNFILHNPRFLIYPKKGCIEYSKKGSFISNKTLAIKLAKEIIRGSGYIWVEVINTDIGATLYFVSENFYNLKGKLLIKH